MAVMVVDTGGAGGVSKSVGVGLGFGLQDRIKWEKLSYGDLSGPANGRKWCLGFFQKDGTGKTKSAVGLQQ